MKAKEREREKKLGRQCKIVTEMDIASSTRTAKDKTRWKGIVAK